MSILDEKQCLRFLIDEDINGFEKYIASCSKEEILKTNIITRFVRCYHSELLESFICVLKRYGASVHAPDQDKFISLHHAIWRTRDSLLCTLLLLGADPNYKTSDEKTYCTFWQIFFRADIYGDFALSDLTAAGMKHGQKMATYVRTKFPGMENREEYLNICRQEPKEDIFRLRREASTIGATKYIRNCILFLSLAFAQLDLPQLLLIVLVKAVCRPFHRVFNYSQICKLLLKTKDVCDGIRYKRNI